MITQETADLVTFTEEIRNGKLHFLCSEASRIMFPIERKVIKECVHFKIREESYRGVSGLAIQSF